MVTGCAGTPSGQVAASVPSLTSTARRLVLPVNATPEAVVRAYLEALDAKDVDTARHLLSERHASQVAGEVDSWFTNVESISDVHVGNTRPESRQGAAAQGSRDAVFVPVDFTLKQKHEETMPNGPTVWGYVFVRNSAKERWLIVDEGPA